MVVKNEDIRWFRCGTLLDGTGGDPLSSTALAIRGGLIESVMPWDSLDPEAQSNATDFSDYTVAPGFIDAHVHLLFTCEIDHEVTRSLFESSSDAELAATGVRNALEALLGGITTTRDCGDTRFITLAIRDAVEAGTLPGPRILAAGPPLTTTGGHLHWCGNTADSVDEVRKAVRKTCAAGVDLVKIMASGGNMTRESNARDPQFTVEEMTVAVKEAQRFGKKTAAHNLNAESIRRSVAARIDTLEHCLWRGDDGQPLPYGELVDLLRPTRTSVVVTMAGIARALLSDANPTSLERSSAIATSPTGSLMADFAWVPELLNAGVNVVLASDAGVRFTPFREFSATIQCGIEAFGISPAKAVSMVTHHAAKALGIEGEVGLISPGMRGDLVILEGTDVSDRLGRVYKVYRNGNLVVDRDSVVIN